MKIGDLVEYDLDEFHYDWHEIGIVVGMGSWSDEMVRVYWFTGLGERLTVDTFKHCLIKLNK